MAIYLSYEGMEGDAKEDGHPKWIRCSSISFSAFREAAAQLGQGGNRQGGNVDISDISLTLPMNPASPHLFVSSLVGTGKKAKIHITRSGSGQQTNFLEISLENTCITSYGVNSDGASHEEAITLNSLNVEMKYIPIKDDGSPGTPVPVAFNLATGAAA